MLLGDGVCDKIDERAIPDQSPACEIAGLKAAILNQRLSNQQVNGRATAPPFWLVITTFRIVNFQRQDRWRRNSSSPLMWFARQPPARPLFGEAVSQAAVLLTLQFSETAPGWPAKSFVRFTLNEPPTGPLEVKAVGRRDCQRLQDLQRKLAKQRNPRGLIGEPDIAGVSSHRQIAGRGIQAHGHVGGAVGR